MLSIFTAELMGTMILILLGNGVVANVVLNGTKGNNSGWIVITAGWAFAVFAGVAVAANLGSGAHLNPAFTIASYISDSILATEILPYLTGQLFGAMLGAFFVWLMHKDHFDATHQNPDTQLACFSTSPAIKNTPLNLVSEIIGTFVLVFVAFSFGASDGNIVGSIGFWPISTLVWAIGLSLGGTTGYAINPARDLGPRIMHNILPIKGKGSSNWNYAWIPIIGPITGAVIAAIVFRLLH